MSKKSHVKTVTDLCLYGEWLDRSLLKCGNRVKLKKTEQVPRGDRHSAYIKLNVKGHQIWNC